MILSPWLFIIFLTFECFEKLESDKFVLLFIVFGVTGAAVPGCQTT